MKIELVRPSFEILSLVNELELLKLIELAGRTCYKSEDKIDDLSCINFIKGIIKRGHESVIEHVNVTVKIICDRGVTHEIVRHRLCAYSQESTRYCNYKNRFTLIIPPWVDLVPGIYDSETAMTTSDKASFIWMESMFLSCRAYVMLLDKGWSPQQARSVLPNSLKTEIVMTANFHEWRHIFKVRCQRAAHPQMQEIMTEISDKFRKLFPPVFEDLDGEIMTNQDFFDNDD